MIILLRVKTGVHAGMTFHVSPGTRLTIGRSIQADLRLDDPEVSRVHCAVENLGDRLSVADLGSSNGTFLNGLPVVMGEVGDGGELHLGAVVLAVRFQHAPAEEPRHPPVPSSRWAPPASLGTRQAMRVGRPDPSGVLAEAGSLRTLLRLATVLGGVSGPEDLAARVAEAAREGCGCQRVALVLRPGNGGTWDFCAASSLEGTPAAMHIDRQVVDRVMSGDECLSGVQEAMGVLPPVRILCAPLPGPAMTLGVLWAEMDGDAPAITERQMAFLEAVGVLVGATIHAEHLQDGLEAAFMGTMRALVMALEARDEYTRGHSERVTTCALALGYRLGDPPAALDVLEVAGLLHDIGKIGIPEAVLHKGGSLSGGERAEMQEHPSAGARIVRNIRHPDVEAIAEAVRHHHEHWDGTGYPDGLAGEAIPRAARIIAVADAWDAMTSNRPYRPALSEAEARGLLREAGGTQLDPFLVEAFDLWLQDGAPTPVARRFGRSRFVPTSLAPLPPVPGPGSEA